MKYLSLALIAALLQACTTHKSETDPDQYSMQMVLAHHTTNSISVNTQYGIKGYYTGPFLAEEIDYNKNGMYANKITISIDSLTEEILYGHSVVAGNARPFQGRYTFTDDIWHVTASEPGDDKYDGVFTFTIYGEAMEIQGTWLANDSKLAVTKRSYTLEKRTFAYDPELALPEDVTWDGIYGSYKEDSDESEAITSDALKYNASTQLLKKEDIENMYKADLEVMRNSIYARHGYSFKNRRMRYVFDNYVDWYMPVSVDITSELTDIERKNIELLKRYEAHAEKYYDVFGR